MMMSDAIHLHGLRGQLRQNEPMSRHTSWRAGGPADRFYIPADVDDLSALLQQLPESEPVLFVGLGSNLLVRDGGWRGTVVMTHLATRRPAMDEGMVYAEAGVASPKVARFAALHQLEGAEFLAGIPGTIGGAVAMNAGTKNGECERVLDAVELATPDGIGWVPRSALTIRYRFTELPAGAMVTRARFRLPDGDVVASRAAMEADLSYRKRTQPLSQPNCGSVFQNPPGDHAGRLIDSVGLKGAQLGSAQISTLHANWIVNLGGARAADVVGLIERAQVRVREATGITLVPEVKRVGAFG